MCECGEAPSVGRMTWPKARRDHTCCECHGTIAAGEKYRSCWGVWDGEAATYRTCGDCLDLEEWCQSDGGSLCTTFGNLHTDVLDYVGESGDESLVAEAKKRVQDVRAKRRRTRQMRRNT